MCTKTKTERQRGRETDRRATRHSERHTKVPRRKLHKNRTNLNNLQIRYVPPPLTRPTTREGNKNYTMAKCIA